MGVKEGSRLIAVEEDTLRSLLEKISNLENQIQELSKSRKGSDSKSPVFHTIKSLSQGIADTRSDLDRILDLAVEFSIRDFKVNPPKRAI